MALIDASVDGILAFDRECRYVAWNRAMESISGVSRDQVLGKRAFDVFPFLKETGEEKYLLEALAGDLAHACLTEFGAARVRVRLTKMNLGWPSGGKAIIEVERRRGQSKAPGREGSPRARARARSRAGNRNKKSARARDARGRKRRR